MFKSIQSIKITVYLLFQKSDELIIFIESAGFLEIKRFEKFKKKTPLNVFFFLFISVLANYLFEKRVLGRLLEIIGSQDRTEIFLHGKCRNLVFLYLIES